jgi:hypothetical protein
MLRRLLPLALPCALLSLAHAQPLTTAFTFQGQLASNAAPVSGVYDLQFRLFDSATGGTQVGPTLCADNVSVTAGQVATQLDFGAQFAGAQRFLEVAVRQDTGLNCSNATGFTTLSPRQPLTATPNAVYSLNAAAASTANLATNASTLNGQPPSYYTNAANLSGSLPSADLAGTYAAQLNLSNSGNVVQGAFTGSGAGLTNVPWSGIMGAPTFVPLDPGFASDFHPGSVNLQGRSYLNALSLGNLNSSYVLEVSPGARMLAGGGDGDALRIGIGPNAMGLTTEASEAILNFDMNFRASGYSTANRGAAVRLDSRVGLPAMQFLTRPAGSTTENTAMVIDEGGRVGIPSIANSVTQFYVNNPSTTPGSHAAEFDCHGPSVAVAAYAYSTGDLSYGIVASATSTSAVAISAQTTAASGQTYAIDTLNPSTSGIAVHANASATSGGTRSLFAENSSPFGWAGYFQGPGADVVYINNTGSGRGLHVDTAADTAVFAQTTSGVAGVDGRTSRSNGYGVIGQGPGYGVYSNGNMGANGTKPFRIDHPADPEHKYLLHYATESPEVINFYRGTVTLDQRGEATVDLPPYFSRINKDPSYQLTAVGAPMPALHISSKISADALAQGSAAAPADPAPLCSFTISGGFPGGEVCWRVEALRNDRWVQAHGAPVELNKEGAEDGTYQHPDLYNQPPERATFYHEPSPAPAPSAPR